LIYREEEREMIPYSNDKIFGKVKCISWPPIPKEDHNEHHTELLANHGGNLQNQGNKLS